jgi:hypothetical protein
MTPTTTENSLQSYSFERTYMMKHTPIFALISILALTPMSAELSPKTADVNLLILIAVILIAAFMVYIFINKRNKY